MLYDGGGLWCRTLYWGGGRLWDGRGGGGCGGVGLGLRSIVVGRSLLVHRRMFC